MAPAKYHIIEVYLPAIVSGSGTGRTLCSYYPSRYQVELVNGGYWGAFGNTAAVAVADFVAPAETIAITERRGVNDPDGAFSDDHLGSSGATPTGGDCDNCRLNTTVRHFEGVNYLFVDGHVKWFKRSREPGEALDANATVNGVYYYFWRRGVTGK